MNLKRYQLPHRLFSGVIVTICSLMGTEELWFYWVTIGIVAVLFGFIAWPVEQNQSERS